MSQLKTRITELLQIEAPIIQGGMAWVAEHNLAGAVSAAGGLGIIGAANAPADWVRGEIRKAREITDKPIGVNVMLLSPYADEVAQVLAEEKVPVITTGAGNPGKYMELWKAAGSKVIPVVASVALARMMERGGADAVIAEGTESGGHIGAATTMTLVPQVVAKESICHPNYKERVIKAKDIDSAVTGRSHGHPIRQLRNQMTKEYIQKEQEGVPFEELELLAVGSLRNAVIDGDVKHGTVMAGQIAGLIKKEQACQEIVDEIMEEAKALMQGVGL